MGDLGKDTAVAGSNGRFTARLSRDWEIWGPNGGYVAAVLLRAAQAATTMSRPVSFSCQYLGVADFDDVDLEVTSLRRASRAEALRVTMRQGERPIAEAQVWAVGDVEGLEHDHAARPSVPPPHEVPTIVDRLGKDHSDVYRFWSNLQSRPVTWVEDWDNRVPARPERYDWYAFVPAPDTGDPFVDACRSLVLIDTLCWPAACLAYSSDMAWFAPSLDLSVRFHRPAPSSEHLLVHSFAPVAADGLVAGEARTYDVDGRLVATGLSHMLCRPAGRPG